MKRTLFVIVALIAVLALAALVAWRYFTPDDPNVLRRLVTQQCLPGERARKNPAPCAQVNLAVGYAVLKDINGPLQYLLMPLWKINGIESPLLLADKTPNFFWQGWQARRWMSEKRGSAVPDSAVSLTINSTLGRTQNHLHIHISCLRPDVRTQLDAAMSAIGSRWQPFPGGLRGHDYLARRMTGEELSRRSPFLMLAQEVPEARDHMGRYSLALAQLKDGAFVLLATRRNLLQLNVAHSEELQDHDCAILHDGTP
ncbi:CDP-diacylglycerol pyrophosphatase [Cronobacter condimenti 1330]|uniref:CDP-diacylglycerol pyrophosphatase n=1 Tax=Cronobacter condimenti 1330 TaxID=1073999 RepID=K8AFH2_9ENTR|nr:CDP-diacylglycerol diphosphatase [Cronobacter condimenti]ALB64555.1 CDP-diacylglycerol pyrophosphatase [Cronobacter condimenti 1330]CCJ74529.1 CDP-diacylglycerol pyrophosphatase [Cronobacter condimenti 1330]